jgi:type I restriction enzyme R subunit
VDIFAATGIEKPDISILAEAFLTEVRGMLQQNLSVDLLRKLLQGELRTRQRKNVEAGRWSPCSPQAARGCRLLRVTPTLRCFLPHTLCPSPPRT